MQSCRYPFLDNPKGTKVSINQKSILKLSKGTSIHSHVFLFLKKTKSALINYLLQFDLGVSSIGTFSTVFLWIVYNSDNYWSSITLVWKGRYQFFLPQSKANPAYFSNTHRTACMFFVMNNIKMIPVILNMQAQLGPRFLLFSKVILNWIMPSATTCLPNESLQLLKWTRRLLSDFSHWLWLPESGWQGHKWWSGDLGILQSS